MQIPKVGDRFHLHDSPESKSKTHVVVVGINEETKFIQFLSEEPKPQRYQRSLVDFNFGLKLKTITPAKCRPRYKLSNDFQNLVSFQPWPNCWMI